MASIERALPSGLQARVAYDATDYITNAIREVLKTLGDTLMIVIVVIFLFLGSFRSVLIPVVAIPMSLIGGVFLMQAFGFTLNLLTLLAIVLSVGLVVDDAIVVVENVERHLREGKTPLEAALVGARELVGPIIAMTVTLAAVYLPIGLQGGLTGSLFREFAFTLAGAVAISGIVALTLSPVMSARLLKPGLEGRGLAGRITRDFKRLKKVYGRLLDATLTARPAVYTVWIVISLLTTAPMFIMSAKELAPTEDQGVIFGILDASANSTLDQNSFFAAEVNQVLHERAGNRFYLPDHLSQLGLQRHGRQTLGQAQAQHLPDHAGSPTEARKRYPASGSSRLPRRPFPAAALSRWNSSWPPRPRPDRSSNSPTSCRPRPRPATCLPSRR